MDINNELIDSYDEDLLHHEEENNTLTNEEFFHDALQSLITVQDMIRWVYSYFQSHQIFFGHGYDNAWDEARVLVLNRIHLPYETNEEYLLYSRLTEHEKREILNLVFRRVHQRIPLAYLIHSSRFLNRNYYIDDRVIIPRSPIGELINKGFIGILHALPSTILDMCTGSGVLAIAMAEKFPEAQVDGVDISPEAIDVANINLELTNDYSLTSRLAFIESDLFSNIPKEATYDLIVSNPPYVNQDDLNSMPEEFHHEPGISLGSGVDGLNLTAKLLAQAANYLKPDGMLIVEVGNSRYALEEALPTVPFNWIDLDNGGHGVFALSREQIIANDAVIQSFASSKLAEEVENQDQ